MPLRAVDILEAPAAGRVAARVELKVTRVRCCTSILISRPLRLRITRRDDLGLVVAIGR